MKRVIRFLCFLLLVVFTVSIALLYSDSGGRLVLFAIQKYAGDVVHVRNIYGRPAQNLHVEGVVIKTPDIDIELDSLSLAWNFSSMLLGRLSVSKVHGSDLKLIFKEGVAKENSAEEFVVELPRNLLPVLGVEIEDLVVDGVSFCLPSGEVVENIDSVQFAGRVDGKTLSFSKLAVEDKDYSITLHGSAVAGTIWQANILGDWRFSNWSGGELLGTLSATGPVPDLDIRVALLAPTKVDIRGKMKNLPKNPYFEVTGTGDFTDLRAIHPSCPAILLNAVAEASGTIDNYRGWLTTTGEYWKFKNITGETRLRGSLADLHFTSLVLHYQDAVINLDGGYLDWQDGFSVGGIVNAHGLNLSVIDEMWDTSLNGSIDGLLTVHEHVKGNYHLRDLSGTWRGFPVTGLVDLHFTEDSLNIDGVELSSGASILTYKGSFAESIDMSLSLNSPHLKEVLPNGSGKLNALLDLVGSYDNPQISGEFAGENLAYLGISLATVKGDVSPLKKGSSSFVTHIQGTGLNAYGVQAGNLDVGLQGNLQKHQGTVRITSSDKEFSVDFLASMLDQQWQATLQRFDISLPTLGDWKLVDPTQLEIGAEGLSLRESCFGGQGSVACVTGTYGGDDLTPAYDVSATVKEFPINQLTASGIAFHPVSGLLFADIKLEGDRDALRRGKATVRVDQGSMLVKVKHNEQVIDLDHTSLNLNFSGQQLQSQFVTAANGSKWDLNLKSDWDGTFDSDLTTMPIDGSLNFKDFDVSILKVIGGYAVQPSGMLHGDLNIKGTLENPVSLGKIVLLDGKVDLPEFGISLKDLRFDVAGHGKEFEIDGVAFSGGGKVSVQGTVLHDRNWDIGGDLTVTGKDFLLLNLPEYEMYVNPDLRIGFDLKQAHIDGKVLIPKAYIAPEEMSDALSESSDVVFLDDAAGNAETVYSLSTRLQLDLGDDITFEGYGLKGRLVGSLAVVDEPANPLMGTGTLSFVDSTFSTYGRSLDIARGRILFTGGSLLNPGLDVRAQKIVQAKGGGRGKYTVGVDISGLFSDLNYSLFSKPYMEDADILAYLILRHSLFDTTGEESTLLNDVANTFGLGGSVRFLQQIASVLPIDDIHMESNMNDDDVSLVVGKNLTEDIYVGYDYNVIGQVGEVRLRYDLKYGFFIESRSSTDAAGADLLYIFER